MPALTETFHDGGFMASDAPGFHSRDQIVVVSGQNLGAGAVIGKVFAGTATSAALGTNTGNGAMGAVTVTGPAMAGVYTLTIIEPAANAGAFEVVNPLGIPIGHGNVAAAFSAGGLAFTLADGGTDFVAGDQFNITVVEGTTSKWKEYNPANTDGSQNAAGILWGATNASAADKAAVAVLRGPVEVTGAELVWFSGANAAQIAEGKRQLALLGIISR